VSERDGFDAEVRCWVDPWQDHPEAAARVYSALFGWEIEETTTTGAERRYLICRLARSSRPSPAARVRSRMRAQRSYRSPS
jgi:hypothetical protein